jgi:hypothetical protein
MIRRAVCVALGFVLVVASGCSRPTASVSGAVHHQNKVVQLGLVQVVDADGMSYSGRIQPDGSYAVEGIPVGPVRFAVISRRPPPKAATKQGKPPGNWFALPKHAEAVGTSGLATELQPGSNTFDLDVR